MTWHFHPPSRAAPVGRRVWDGFAEGRTVQERVQTVRPTIAAGDTLSMAQSNKKQKR